MNSEQKQKIEAVLGEAHVAVVATNAGAGAPESAVVTISHISELGIIFCSKQTARKNKNIAQHPHISCVVGWDETDRTTLQIEGVVTTVVGEERARYAAIHTTKHPHFTKMADNLEWEYFVLVPHWIRYSNLVVVPTEVWEVAL